MKARAGHHDSGFRLPGRRFPGHATDGSMVAHRVIHLRCVWLTAVDWRGRKESGGGPIRVANADTVDLPAHLAVHISRNGNVWGAGLTTRALRPGEWEDVAIDGGQTIPAHTRWDAWIETGDLTNFGILDSHGSNNRIEWGVLMNIKLTAIACVLGCAGAGSAGLPAHLQIAARALVTGTVYKYETEHFAIFYQTTGKNAVAGAAQVDGSGVPYAIDSIGKFAEYSWHLAVDTLKYKAPVGRATSLLYQQAVPSGKMPLEVGDVGLAIYGTPYNTTKMGATADPSTDPDHKGSDILVENDFLYNSPQQAIQAKIPSGVLYDYSTYKDMYKGWAVTVAHEFFHTVEFGYEYAYQYAFHEMCAVWFGIRAYPQIHHHWQYLRPFLQNIYSGSFATGTNAIYYNHAFVRVVASLYGDEMIRKIWELRSHYIYLDTGTLDEAPWFRKVIDSLGMNEYSIIKELTKQTAYLGANHPGLLNDSGKYSDTVFQGAKHHWTPDTTMNGGFSMTPGNFGIAIETFGWPALPSGLNLLVPGGNLNLSEATVAIQQPSLQMDLIDNRPATTILGLDPSDTAIIVYYGGFGGYDLEGRYTHAPATLVSPRRSPTTPLKSIHRFDLYGRPISDSYHGIVIETDGLKSIRTIQVK